MHKRPPSKSEATTKRMSAVRRKGTAPELAVRELVSSLRHRYRVNSNKLPGSPDLSNLSKGWAIMVHGCFWHGHERCRLASVPKSNHKWWKDKLIANRNRDLVKEQKLKARGLRVLVIWQCELKRPEELRRRLMDFLPT